MLFIVAQITCVSTTFTLESLSACPIFSCIFTAYEVKVMNLQGIKQASKIAGRSRELGLFNSGKI